MIKLASFVAEDTPRFAGTADALIPGIVIRCGNGQPAGIQQGFIKLSLYPREHPFLGPDVKLRGEGESIHGQSGPRFQQQARLALSHIAAAYKQAVAMA